MKENFGKIFILIGSRRPKDALHFFEPECKTHTSCTPDGMNELNDAIIVIQKQSIEGILKESKADFMFVIK